MKLVFNSFDPTHFGEKKQIPVFIEFKKKMVGEFYCYVVFPNGHGMYMSVEDVETYAMVKINLRTIKTL